MYFLVGNFLILPVYMTAMNTGNCLQLDVRSLRVKLADFGLSRTVERSGNDLSLFHARWTAPEVWDDYIDDDDYVEGDLIGNYNNYVPLPEFNQVLSVCQSSLL